MTTTRRLLIASLSAAALVGCATSQAKTTVRQPKTIAIASGRTVALNLTSDADENSREVAQKTRSVLHGRLVSEDIFRQVLPAGESADYGMDVKLSNIVLVSQEARMLFAALAGANELTAEVTLRSKPDNSTITVFTVTGKSAANLYSSENDMNAAIEEVVMKIVDALR